MYLLRSTSLLKKSKSGMLFLDLVITLIIIGFLIWVFGGMIGSLTQNVKETALRYQLKNFRMVLNLYRELKGEYPQDLQVLLATDYKMAKEDKPVLGEKFLINPRQDLKGIILDAFGNGFYYDHRKGVVGSTTKGYENW